MAKTKVKRLFILNGGSLLTDQERAPISSRKSERWLTTPIPFFLVQTENENILFDTGCDPDVVDDPKSTWGSLTKVFVPQIRRDDHPVNRLKELGVNSQDITHVVLSHLHFDHAGGIRFFPQAQIIVQKAEYRYAYHPDRYSGGYFTKDFDYPSLSWQLIEGDLTLVPGVTLVTTSGHSPGHQSMVVDLPSGLTVILAADALYLQENIEKEIVSPGSWNPALAFQSIRRLKVIAERSEGLLLPNHDSQMFDQVKRSPDFYE